MIQKASLTFHGAFLSGVAWTEIPRETLALSAPQARALRLAEDVSFLGSPADAGGVCSLFWRGLERFPAGRAIVNGVRLVSGGGRVQNMLVAGRELDEMVPVRRRPFGRT